MKKLLFSLFAVVLLFIFSEVACFLGLITLKHQKNIIYEPLKETLTQTQKESIIKIIHGSEKYIAFDPELGWTVIPNGAAGLYQSNSKGIRANKEFTLAPLKNTIRIASFGDSFVHGDEVSNTETWQFYLDQLNPHLENLNFGVSGYGLDQAYLRYLIDGRQYKPNIVIIGFMSENPSRAVNIFRPFYEPQSGLAMTKPRYRLVNDQLQLVENPLQSRADYQALLNNESHILNRMIEYDYFYQFRYTQHPLDHLASARLYKVFKSLPMLNPQTIYKDRYYNTESEIYQVNMALLKKFYETANKDGAIPIIVIFANSSDILRQREYGFKNYQPFLDEIKKNHWHFVDITDEMLNDKRNKFFTPLFAPKNHTSSLGNQRVAEYIYNYLKENQFLTAN